jgi:dUTP pyrophosphatase
MRISARHNNFVMPDKSTERAGAFDIYMPEDGSVSGHAPKPVGLGFAAEVPDGHVALILPRSEVGAKYGVELNNTCGVIQPGFTGEWKVTLKTKTGATFHWEQEDKVLQFIVAPVANIKLEQVDELED